MTGRVLLAAIVGAVAMFIWMFLAHMVLPLGTIGVQQIPNEEPILSALTTSIGGQRGLYLFPGMGTGPNPTMKEMREAMPAYEKKLASSPSGLLMYHPAGTRAGLNPGMLGLEFGKEFVMTLLALALLSLTRLDSYGAKVGFVTVVGVIAAMSTNISYFVFYGFPGNYTAAYMFTEAMGFLAAGLAGAALLRRPASRGAAA